MTQAMRDNIIAVGVGLLVLWGFVHVMLTLVSMSAGTPMGEYRYQYISPRGCHDVYSMNYPLVDVTVADTNASGCWAGSK